MASKSNDCPASEGQNRPVSEGGTVLRLEEPEGGGGEMAVAEKERGCELDISNQRML